MIVGATWIDYEDLFMISHDIRDGVVISDEWGTLPIVTEHGDKMEIPCHYIDFKMVVYEWRVMSKYETENSWF